MAGALLCVWLLSGWGGPVESLTFEQAAQRVEQRNEAIKAAEEQVRERGAKREAARGLRYPQVELEVRRYLLDDPVNVGVDSLPIELEVQSYSFWHAPLTMQWPLYTGGRIAAANAAAEAHQEEAKAGVHRTEHELLTTLAERYYGMCLAQQARGVQALKTAVMKRHVARAKRLVEEGIIARIEYLNAKVALANAERELSEAERNVAIVAEGLANVVVSEAEDISPVSPLFILRDMAPCAQFQAYVDEQHPVLRTLDAKRARAQQGVRAKKGEYRPTVFAFGMRELKSEDLTMLDPKWALGLGMKYKIFSGFSRKHKVDAAEAVERRVGHLRSKYRRDLRSLVLKRYQEMLKARDQFDTLEATLDLTEENLRVRTRAFEEGVATSVEVIDATLSHARAQLGRFKAAYDFDLALFQLLEASGRSAQWPEYVKRAEPVEAQTYDLESEGPIRLPEDRSIEVATE